FPPAVFPLSCVVQNYSWGKVGLQSEVAKLVASGDPLVQIQPDQPYAELWMGTHPRGDALIRDNRIPQKTLGQWIADNPACLGAKVKDAFQGHLPFLFKVLSVNTALSVQAHPNKELAAKLHAQFPEHYPDANHKPEMAIALTPFEAMCGFRPVEEIVSFLQSKGGGGGMVRPRGGYGGHGVGMVAMVPWDGVWGGDGGPLPWDREGGPAPLGWGLVWGWWPCSLGMGSGVGMRAVLSWGGFGVWMGAVPPWDGFGLWMGAVLSWDCVEVMACSDNTVRAGLTPKFIDVLTLCEMLNYTPAPSSSKILLAAQSQLDPHVYLYDPPVPDFTIMRIEIPASIKLYLISAMDSASILLVIQGTAVGTSTAAASEMSLRRGSVLFVSANESISLHLSSPDGMLLFRACCLL
ncbi:MPI isomerase, partial [Rhodinocichla rosea]|nr:MPI isomerase [Rhodinocichla rosea]